MPRAVDIAYLMVFISLAVGFVNGLGVFDHSYLQQPEITGSYANVSATRDSLTGSSTVGGDFWSTNVGFLISGINFIKDFIFGAFTLAPILGNMFGVPPVVYAFVVPGMAICYGIFLMQLLTRMGWGGIKD